MDIGKRIRAVREAKGLSQGDIERRSGLLRSYISRVEGGYTAPSLPTLEKFAKSLEVEPYQLLFPGGHPRPARLPEQTGVSKAAKKLVKLFDSLSTADRNLLVSMAGRLAKR